MSTRNTSTSSPAKNLRSKVTDVVRKNKEAQKKVPKRQKFKSMKTVLLEGGVTTEELVQAATGENNAEGSNDAKECTEKTKATETTPAGEDKTDNDQTGKVVVNDNNNNNIGVLPGQVLRDKGDESRVDNNDRPIEETTKNQEVLQKNKNYSS